MTKLDSDVSLSAYAYVQQRIRNAQITCLKETLTEIEAAVTPLFDRMIPQSIWNDIGPFWVADGKVFYVRASEDISSVVIQVMSAVSEGDLRLHEEVALEDFLARPGNELAKKELLSCIAELVWVFDNVLAPKEENEGGDREFNRSRSDFGGFTAGQVGEVEFPHTAEACGGQAGRSGETAKIIPFPYR